MRFLTACSLIATSTMLMLLSACETTAPTDTVASSSRLLGSTTGTPMLNLWPDSAELSAAGYYPGAENLVITAHGDFSNDLSRFRTSASLTYRYANQVSGTATAKLVDDRTGNTLTTDSNGFSYESYRSRLHGDTVWQAAISTLGHTCDVTGFASASGTSALIVGEGEFEFEFYRIGKETQEDIKEIPSDCLPPYTPEDECDDPFTDEVEECGSGEGGSGGSGGSMEYDVSYDASPPENGSSGVVLACYYRDWYSVDGGSRTFIESEFIGCWLEMVDELP